MHRVHSVKLIANAVQYCIQCNSERISAGTASWVYLSAQTLNRTPTAINTSHFPNIVLCAFNATPCTQCIQWNSVHKRRSIAFRATRCKSVHKQCTECNSVKKTVSLQHSMTLSSQAVIPVIEIYLVHKHCTLYIQCNSEHSVHSVQLCFQCIQCNSVEKQCTLYIQYNSEHKQCT